MSLDFTAIDFETANSSPASACSVGLARVRDGAVVETASWRIRPPLGHDHFLEWNTRIHGITAADVAEAPLWGEQLAGLRAFTGEDRLVAHNAGFDMGVIRAACAASGLATPDYGYLCSLRLARRTYHLDSYRLPVVAMAAGFEDFRHHDALDDSLACTAIVVHAARRHGATSLEELAAISGCHIRHLGDERDARPAVLG
ncbi:MAG: 3'-5' exonuclease [Microbacteriaceae bacterium]